MAEVEGFEPPIYSVKDWWHTACLYLNINSYNLNSYHSPFEDLNNSVNIFDVVQPNIRFELITSTYKEEALTIET